MNASTEISHQSPPTGSRAAASADLRDRLIEAAIQEFASYGFEGASTRRIAERAEAHQPQINYHFDSKLDLWKAVMLKLLAEVDDSTEIDPDSSPRDAVAAAITGVVALAARRPELNRMMIHEGTHPSERLEWLVETQLKMRAEPLLEVWGTLVESGEAADIPPELLYHTLVGAASLLHANAPEARLLVGIEPTDPAVVESQTKALIELFLPTSRKRNT